MEVPAGESWIDIVPDEVYEDVPNEVADCAITTPSLFLSDGVISMEDEPPVDAP